MLRIFDLHCDTAYRMYKNKLSFSSEELALSYGKIKKYSGYTAVFAFWSDDEYSDDECFRIFIKSRDYFLKNMEDYPKSKIKYAIAVEDARILSGSLDRLRVLYTSGVRILTAVWRGTSCVGGAYDVSLGLTPFGKQVIKKCHETGIIPDVSHASEKTFYDIADISCSMKRPIIASHSDSYAICPHPRNLFDSQFEIIKNLKGIVGICMAAEHVSEFRDAKINDVIRHIEHYMSLGGEDLVCLGCDFDGITYAPRGLENAGKLVNLAESLAKLNYSEKLIDKVFYSNAKSFFDKNISFNL
ncbi:MAG: membrane dipeptidase [Eubacteriales bacterium]|nr:membrane dipeptidase [Eubacteriales bacterium]